MLKKYIVAPLIIIICLITTNVFGQTDYQDVVYLKNGSIIRGMIIEQVPNQSLKIETADRNVFVYTFDEIEKITKEASVKSKSASTDGELFGKGYNGVIDLGYAFGVGNLGLDFIKLNIVNGHRFNQNFALGFGTGIRYYSDIETIFIPLFADVRANFTTADVAPYFALNLGYTLNASQDFEGVGLLFSPSLGAMFKINDKTAVNFSVGYEMQKMKVSYYYFNPYGYGFPTVFETNRNINSLSLNLGFTL